MTLTWQVGECMRILPVFPRPIVHTENILLAPFIALMRIRFLSHSFTFRSVRFVFGWIKRIDLAYESK